MIKLNEINPTAKLLSNLVVLLACAVIFDPKTMFMLLFINVAFGILTGAFNKRNIKALIPLLLFAFAMLWMNAAWAKVENPHVIGKIGMLNFTDKGFIVGLSLSFRVMTIGISSIVFTSSTAPDELVLSLIKECRLNPGIAYGILTAFRFLPSMEADLALINAAHRIRSAKSKKWYLKKNHWYRNAIPLLAVNVRKAERVAIAMEARGFENNMERTYYRTVLWKRIDTVVVACTFIVISAVIIFSAHMGWLISFKRWQGF